MNRGGIYLTYQFIRGEGTVFVRAVGGVSGGPKLRTRQAEYKGAITLDMLKAELLGMLFDPKYVARRDESI